MNILVTGGSGLVGRYVVEELRQTHQVEILDLKQPDQRSLPYHSVDLLDEASVKKHVQGFDVVVHLAGIPHPLNDPPETVFRTNVLGTFNLLEACAANGIRRIVFISSESVLGFAFSTTHMWPEYAPIDEHHPLRPQDAYGVSKLTCEQLCNAFTRRTGMQTICLRPPWIWVPEPREIKLYRQLRTEYPKWYQNLWAYIHVYDVAKAVRQCTEASNLPVHDAFFICASETWVDVDTRTLLSKYFPETRRISSALTGTKSIISSEKAGSAFGFAPEHSWKEILQ